MVVSGERDGCKPFLHWTACAARRRRRGPAPALRLPAMQQSDSCPHGPSRLRKLLSTRKAARGAGSAATAAAVQPAPLGTAGDRAASLGGARTTPRSASPPQAERPLRRAEPPVGGPKERERNAGEGGGEGTDRHQGCSNRESRESRGAKKRRFAPNREALNKIPNRPNRYSMTPAVQWELIVVAQTYLSLQRWV